MKTYSLRTLVLALLLLGAWQCAIIDPSDESRGYYFAATKNGRGWQGQAEASFQGEERTTLVILGVLPGGQALPEEVVGIRLLFNGLGMYPVEPEAGFYYTVIGGDVVDRQYESFGSVDDQAVISRYDSTARIIEGTFRLRLKNTRAEEDQVSFQVRGFRARILN